MYKVAVMGDRDSIYGFASAGLDVFPVDDHASAVRRLRTLAESDYAVIYIPEAMFTDLAKEVAAYDEACVPAIIPIPGVYGNTGIGIARVKKSVEKAVGSDIIFGEK